MVAPNACLYLFDLAGYGQSPVNMLSDDVCCIAGWNDKVFDIFAAVGSIMKESDKLFSCRL